MNLRIYSRTGNFDMMHPSDQSISTHIAIYDGEEKVRSINIETDYEVSQDDFEAEDVISVVDDLIERQIKKIWISTSENEWREFWGFMLAHEDEITKGQMEYKIDCLKKSAEDYYKKYKSVKHNIQVYKDMIKDLTPTN